MKNGFYLCVNKKIEMLFFIKYPRSKMYWSGIGQYIGVNNETNLKKMIQEESKTSTLYDSSKYTPEEMHKKIMTEHELPRKYTVEWFKGVYQTFQRQVHEMKSTSKNGLTYKVLNNLKLTRKR
jgi:hypothetical protein